MTEPDDPKPFEWNRQYGDHIDDMGMQLLESYSPRIDEVHAKQNGPYVAVVEPRSSLQLDDPYLGTWRAGSLPVGAMAASSDALQTVRVVVLEAQTMPMTALYPVLRAVIENAALAIYLLAPRERDNRLKRAYQVADDDARLRRVNELERALSIKDIPARDLAIEAANQNRDKVRAEIRQLVGMRPALGSPEHFVFTKVEYNKLVALASAELDADPAINIESDMSLLAMWQVLSGLSHGKQWAMVEVLERSMAIVNEETGTAHIRMSSSPGVIAWFLERGLQTLECALRLYGQRSNTQWAQPEDATDPKPAPPTTAS